VARLVRGEFMIAILVSVLTLAAAASRPEAQPKSGGTLVLSYQPEPSALSTIATTAAPTALVAKGVRVGKFKVGQQQLLLAYQFDARRNLTEVLDVGPHENFSRDLQTHLADR
jgi:hypothetical protein